MYTPFATLIDDPDDDLRASSDAIEDVEVRERLFLRVLCTKDFASSYCCASLMVSAEPQPRELRPKRNVKTVFEKP